MKQHRQARVIAENIYYCGKTKLTAQEKETLRNSPFANLLEKVEKPNFLKLAEQIEDSLSDVRPPKKTERSSIHQPRYHTGHDTRTFRHLIHEIEDHFELGVPYDYDKLPVEKLKAFIEQFIRKEVFDEETGNKIQDLIKNQDHSEMIMADLRLYAAH